MTIYQCGAMSIFYEQNRYDNAISWRKYSKEILNQAGIKVFDPTLNSKTHFTYPDEYSNGVILQNYAYLKKCDIVLVNLDMFEDSIGGAWEISIAWVEHKPIIAFGRCKKWENRPHFKSLITVTCNNIEDACDYIISMYDQKI